MKKKIGLFTIIGIVLGLIFGLFFKDYVVYVEPIGSAYILVLKFLIVPVIFTSISLSIYRSRNMKNALVIKTVLLFIVMFVVSFLLSSVIVTLMKPAKGFSLEGATYEGETTTFSIKNIFINLIPQGIVGSIKALFGIEPYSLEQFANDLYKFCTGGYLFFVIIVSILVGVIASNSKKEENGFIDGVESVKRFLFEILNFISYIAPLAAFSLIAVTASKFGTALFSLCLKYILTAFVSSLVVLIVVMILPVLIITKMTPIEFIKKVNKIWLMTISTCSSSATLPYTIKLCNEDLGIPENITDVVVPLGCTIHMCGGAISFSLLGLFCIDLFGINLTVSGYIIMLIYALLINMSAPGIPNGGVVIGASYLNLLGIPLNFIGLYSGTYKILDMMYTTLNVTGDITANVILNKICSKNTEA